MSTRPSEQATRTPMRDGVAQFAEDVHYYLQQNPRQLPSRYLYDALGSALFDAICRLPWYPITRAELGLLDAHGAEILAHAQPLSTIVELGGGNGDKLAALVGGAQPGHLAIHLIDVSPAALALSSRLLAALGDFTILTHEMPYESGLLAAAANRRAGAALTLFLGSNIGNFDPPAAEAFLCGVRASMRRGDAFLLGADLVKSERALLAAYDDPLGVTAAFNRNLLVRINEELGGDFDLDGFVHRAVWNAAASRVEMHLVSLRRQRIHVAAPALDLELGAGEIIWTESSYKYTPEGIGKMLRGCGFAPVRQWTEPAARFALTLADAA